MQNDTWRESWTRTIGADEYGELFFQRATGAMDEMESSKAAARRMSELMRDGDTVADVGCGAGHYLVSLKKTIAHDYRYIGIDATANYVELARKAFAGDDKVEFRQGDIFKLPLEDQSVDVAMCNNVLLHLPSVETPLAELVRIARRTVLVRTLIGDTSFAIRHVDPAPGGDEFENLEPKAFHFLNIYSQDYVRHILSKQDRVSDVEIVLDCDFDESKLTDTADALQHAWDATRAVNGMQISGYIVQPWSWLKIDLKQA